MELLLRLNQEKRQAMIPQHVIDYRDSNAAI